MEEASMRTFKLEKEQPIRDQLLNVYNCAKEGVLTHNLVIEIKQWNKSREQEKKYHAMIGDFAKQIKFDYQVQDDFGKVARTFGKRHQRKYAINVWKALLVEQFATEMKEQGQPLKDSLETVLSFDGLREISVRPSSKEFSIPEAANFITFLECKGAELGVNFSDRALTAYNDYKEAA
jgi:hypothetical protein